MRPGPDEQRAHLAQVVADDRFAAVEPSGSISSRTRTPGSPRAIERHVEAVFQKLRLPDSEDDNRRVLAVLAVLALLGQ